VAGIGIIDRIVSAFAPEAGLRRTRARLQADAATRNFTALYDGAARTHRTAGRRISSTSADRETAGAIRRLRDVARDLVRNNAYAARAVQVISANMVGAGIIPSVQCESAPLKRRVQALVRQHLETTAVDADGRNNIYGLQALVARTVAESGEALLLRIRTPASRRLPVPLQVRVLEPDYLDSTKDQPIAGGGRVSQGVEYDRHGTRVAYWLFDAHPGDTTSWQRETSRRIPADDVAHIYRLDRPGQSRGVTWLAPVLMPIWDLGEYEDAELVRQRVAACFAAFVMGEDQSSTLASANGASMQGLPVDALEPGTIQSLPNGTDIKFSSPPLTAGYPEYLRSKQRSIAIGLNVPYEALTGDLERTNFSSGRMGWLEFSRAIDQWRWHMLIPQMCDPICGWFREAAAIGLNGRTDYTFSHTPPRREMIDPTKEIPAARDAVRAGFSSRSEEVRKLGYDPETVEQEIAAENARADGLAQKFDSDGRYPATMPLGGQIRDDADGTQFADR
jgi:lambda family phage portal protein